MFDWQVGEDEPPAAPLAEAPTRSRARWRWLLLLLPLLLVVAGLTYRQAREREEALRSDLQAFIDEEERARAFGLVEEAERFAVEDTSERWLSGYQGRFVHVDGAAPPSVTIERINLRGRGTQALVMVNEGEEQRLRAYRHGADGWRRAPLPKSAWGAERTLSLAGGTMLRFWALDEAFAEQLAADWQALLVTVPYADALDLTEVKIEPVEFRRPTHLSDGSDGLLLLLASPKLVGNDPWLSGEELIRYELARVLLAHTLSGVIGRTVDEGAVQQALEEVSALRWALSAERLAMLRERWRDQVEGRWASPLQVELQEALTWETRPGTPRAPTAVTLLLADLLLSLDEADNWPQLFENDMLRLRRWDDRLQSVLDQSAYAVTARLERYVAEGYAAALEATPGDPPSGTGVQVGTLHESADQDLLLLYGAEGGRGTPVNIEQAALTLPDGTPLPRRCAPLFDEVRIEGLWSSSGQTFLADRILVESLTPAGVIVSIPPTPDTAIALLIGPSVAPSEEPFDPTLDLLLDDGTTEPLYEPTSRLLILDIAEDDDQTLLLGTPSLPGCPARWLYTYHPQSGSHGPWLLTFAAEVARHFIFSGGEREGPWLLTSFGEETQNFRPLLPNDPILGTTHTLSSGMVVGWRSAEQEVVVAGYQEGSITLSYAPLDGGAPTRAFSMEGSHWLQFHPQPSVLVLGEEDTVSTIQRLDTEERYDLSQPLSAVPLNALHVIALWAEEERLVAEGYAPAAPSEERWRLVALSFDGEEVDRYAPADNFVTVSTAPCPNGEALIMNQRENPSGTIFETHIERWRPGSEPAPPLTLSSDQGYGGRIVCLLNE